MFCKHCGASIDDDSKFCPVCGKIIENKNTETNFDNNNINVSTNANRVDNSNVDRNSNTNANRPLDTAIKVNDKKKMSRIVLAAVIVLLAVLGVVLFIKPDGNKKSKENVSSKYAISESVSSTEKTTAEVTEKTTAEVTEKTTAEVTEKTTAEVTEKTTAEVTEKTTAAQTTEAATELVASSADFNSYEAIAELIGLQAKCETSAEACRCGLNYSKNPYDVDYDYGDLYQSYVDACDWSLVFDADYYAEQFPYLALQYNYDKDWLLYHFQTIGIHEGRQGCADFNVRVYLDSTCYDNGHIYETFDKNWECYYFYYMLNYDSQKSLKTVAKDGIEAKFQYKTILTYNQAKELDQLNTLRAENNLPALQINSELNAFATYRARIDFEGHYYAHAWAESNTDYCLNMAKTVAANYDLNVITTIYAENKTIRREGTTKTGYDDLLKSEDHKAQMLYDNISYTGLSNNFNGFNDFEPDACYNKNADVNFEIFI